MDVRVTDYEDIEVIMDVEARAFGHEKEAILTRDLLKDPSAVPFLSLLAFEDEVPVGHILFTNARMEPDAKDISIQILGPLAVVPEHQRTGVGTMLMEKGLEILKGIGTDLVFVAGHPEYYPRSGFSPAGVHGFEPPYPIPEKDADAWMVLELRDGIIGTLKGTVMVADALDKPEHWRD